MRIHAGLLAGAIAVLALCPSCSRRDAQATGAQLSAEISYRALWWSTAQMDGMNPNTPPPKTTEITLTRWEYTDPIGTPHPDVVDVTVTLANQSDAPARNVVVDTGLRWSVGPLKDKSKAVWEAETFTPLRTSDRMTIAPHATRTVKVPVELAAKMKSLEARELWPWALETQAIISADGATSIKKTAVLPITPGD